ncbi:Uncharacterised protein [Mycobacteroides abscessus subsp. abscessus]|nr:Uncharacterised protein [Mycobacteroides abscessus subsp. abscessus]SKV36127.1 Uncharacterised protein [Mycobacteroides abscessus subsp. abscessus]
MASNEAMAASSPYFRRNAAIGMLKPGETIPVLRPVAPAPTCLASSTATDSSGRNSVTK